MDDERSLSQDELVILMAAAIDAGGEYSVWREYGKPWGAEHAAMISLERRGYMKIKSAGRVPLVNRWSRQSTITEAGRTALAATQNK